MDGAVCSAKRSSLRSGGLYLVERVDPLPFIFLLSAFLLNAHRTEGRSNSLTMEAAQVAKEDHKEVKPAEAVKGAEEDRVAASCRSAEAPQFLRPPPSKSPHQ